MTQKEKMLNGKPYRAFGEKLLGERQHAKEMLFEFNNLYPTEINNRNEIIKKLFGNVNDNFFIEPPFKCDYGYNISIGDNFYANYNCIILDCAKVTIDDNVVIGSGSVVTKDIPCNSIAVGDPCKVIREITDKDKQYYFKNLQIKSLF